MSEWDLVHDVVEHPIKAWEHIRALEAEVKALRVGIIKHTALIEMFDVSAQYHLISQLPESIAESGKELRRLALLQDERGK